MARITFALVVMALFAMAMVPSVFGECPSLKRSSALNQCSNACRQASCAPSYCNDCVNAICFKYTLDMFKTIQTNRDFDADVRGLIAVVSNNVGNTVTFDSYLEAIGENTFIDSQRVVSVVQGAGSSITETGIVAANAPAGAAPPPVFVCDPPSACAACTGTTTGCTTTADGKRCIKTACNVDNKVQQVCGTITTGLFSSKKCT